MNCQVIGDTGSSSHASGSTKGSPENSVCGSSDVVTIVSGWMYLNELGQMCGPYISQQLLEGLSSGFLPDELPVYPVMNGVTMAAVPLKLFKEYPDHVSTAFTSLSRSSSAAIIQTSPMQDIHSDIQPNSNNQGLDQQTSYSSNMTISDSKVASSTIVEQQQSLTWDNKCWSYLDGYGRVAGPYTLSELYYWHQYGYLPDSVMIRHVENRFSPSTLLSLLTAIRNDELPSSAISGHGTSGSVEIISNVSEEIGSQLHNGIMKAARRLVLEEIIGDVVVDFVAGKKARKQVKIKQESNGFRNCFLEDKKIKVCPRDKNGCVAPTDVVAYHDAATPEDKCTKESFCPNNTKTIGGVENFQAAKTVISKRLFDYCSEVLWNAVFYDLVANCALSWRNSRRWSYSCFERMTRVPEESSNVVTISDAVGQVRELDSPDDELEFPPGFHHKQKDGSLSNDDREGTIARVQDDREETIALVQEDKEGSIAKVQDDREETIARVQEQLFLASKASMVDCLKTCVKEEALKLYDCLKDKQLSEVSTEVIGQLSNVTDTGDPAPSELAQGLDTGHISIDGPPSQGMSSPHPLAPDEQFSISFLGNSFKRLGAPSGIAVDDPTMDEPPPPGLAGVGMDISPQLLQMSFLNQFRTQQASVPLYKDCSVEFLGSAFQRLGKPICFSVDDQRTDEPPPPGSQGACSNVVSSGNHKFQRLVLDVSMPKWRKFVILALFRQKLHDDVLKQWKSSFHDSLRCRLQQRDQEGTSVGNEPMANLTSALEHDLDLLAERSKSCHDSGPSEVSVVEFTYSRRKMSKKFSAPVSSQDLQSSKCGKQSISKKFVRAEVDKHAADQIGLKVESAPRTSKTGASVKSSLIKNGPPVRSSNPRKRQKVAGAAQAVAAKDHVNRVEKVAAAPVDSNDADDLASSSKVTIADKVSTHRLQLKKNSPDISKLKRKCVMDESPSHQSKAAKLVKGDAKQASCKKVANGKTQASKSRVMSSCPVSRGCARCSIDGWEWRKWSLNARPAERARVRGIKLTTMQHFGSESNSVHPSHAKGISARTNRVKLRSLLAAAEGAEILKASQLKARKKRLRFQRSKIHDWGLIALEPIEAEDFVIEYVGELIRPRISDIREREYEKMGIGSSYLFRLDDGYVVDATKRGGIARFINHSCEPNCYTKTVTVDGQKRIFIYAKRHIASGQEITYNYKFPLEEKKIPCNCGAKRCRGSMN